MPEEKATPEQLPAAQPAQSSFSDIQRPNRRNRADAQTGTKQALTMVSPVVFTRPTGERLEVYPSSDQQLDRLIRNFLRPQETFIPQGASRPSIHTPSTIEYPPQTSNCQKVCKKKSGTKRRGKKKFQQTTVQQAIQQSLHNMIEREENNLSTCKLYPIFASYVKNLCNPPLLQNPHVLIERP
ncbi:hypothetical protein M406DRAFT_326606 [Cryphonectria parasitica EP155]|uniref:Uncharacterized protein n=1 Tax=Cryphonectria parasitica (strain ATCC 38755 / EP155) TaxID=660469 RepID=A0A9P5CWP8_CRYP1|nr:uncharacterized protein M406DRAFT_326606 [Cryphonectria parasitica EP155]KAF3771215.1 hypothetical protein M406DRAFT_326606 [Cryphonectria parasitica EP155]